MTGVGSAPGDVSELRRRMVDGMRGEYQTEPSEQVTHALLTVPRHLFLPEVNLEQGYAPGFSLVTKRDTQGTSLSVVSAPYIQASMLDMADLRPGMRVLEIGSSGYNAALIAEIIGPAGHVVTIDIDADVVQRADSLLAATGYDRVRVVHGDAEHSVPGEALFDRIIVTVGAWDLPPAWWDQLVDDGRIVLPLLIRGTCRTVALDKRDGWWVHAGHTRSGFVHMQGLGAHPPTTLSLTDDEQVALRVDGEPGVDARPLARALEGPWLIAWSGVETVGNEPFDDMDLFALTWPGPAGLLWASPAAVESKLVNNWARFGAPTRYSSTGFAYRVSRRVPGTEYESEFRGEFGARAHGRDAQEVADQLVELLRTWDREHRGHPAEITVVPADTHDEVLPPGRVMDRRHTRVIVSWPTGRDPAGHPAAPSG